MLWSAVLSPKYSALLHGVLPTRPDVLLGICCLQRVVPPQLLRRLGEQLRNELPPSRRHDMHHSSIDQRLVQVLPTRILRVAEHKLPSTMSRIEQRHLLLCRWIQRAVWVVPRPSVLPSDNRSVLHALLPTRADVLHGCNDVQRMVFAQLLHGHELCRHVPRR